MKRTTITLTDELERVLVEFAKGGPYRDALAAWAEERGRTLPDPMSEAALLRLLLDFALHRLQEARLDIAYSQMALTYDLDHDARKERRAIAQRNEERRAKRERAAEAGAR